VGDQVAAGAYTDLVEDRLQVVLDGVQGQVQGLAGPSGSSATAPVNNSVAGSAVAKKIASTGSTTWINRTTSVWNAGASRPE